MKKNIINLKQSGGFFKALTLLASGSIIGQIVAFVGSMFMTRLYTQEAIGIMTLVISVTGMFAPVINGRFDYAIVKERNNTKVMPLIKLALVLGIVFSFIVGVGSFFYFTTKKEAISPSVAALFVCLILLITTFTNVFRSFNNRVEDYKTMTWVIVIRKLAESLSMIIFGFFHGGSVCLLISRVCGEFLGMRQQTKNIHNSMKKIWDASIEQMKIAFIDHRKQLFYSTPAALMNSASYSLISIFIGELFGLDKVAVYSISFSVLGLPLSVISGNISKVYFGEASKEFAQKGSFRKSTKQTSFIVIGLSFVVFLGMYSIIPPLVPIVYGKAYDTAGTIIRILAPMFAVRFIASSMATGLVVGDKQQYDVILQAGFILSAICIYIFTRIQRLSMEKFLVLFAICYAVVYLFYYFSVYIISGKKISD